MKKSILVGVLLVSSLAFGQKKNVTSAAVEFQGKYKPALKSQDYELAKKSLITAKGFIDLAIEHPDTKGDQKANYYKGAIYYAAANLAATTGDQEFLKTFGEKTEVLNQSCDALKYAFTLGKKYKSDVEDVAYLAQNGFYQIANAAYNAEEYKSAADAYGWSAKFMSAIGALDTSAVFNTGFFASKYGDHELAAKSYEMAALAGYRGSMSYALAAGSYRDAGNLEKAKEIVNAGRKLYPNDRDLLLELVNNNLAANDPVAAEAALNDAIAADPKNKQLHYTIGTIYIDLKENEKAEIALNKALEIDPEYMDAQYQLGAHLVSWAADLRTEANNLKLGDAMYDVKLAQSNEIFARAAAPLEKYISKNPNDAPVLKILSQLYKSIGNNEKFQEYKKRAAEAQ